MTNLISGFIAIMTGNRANQDMEIAKALRSEFPKEDLAYVHYLIRTGTWGEAYGS